MVRLCMLSYVGAGGSDTTAALQAIVEAFHITEPYIEMEIARLENEDEEEEEEEEESSEDEPPTGKRARR